MKFKNNKIQIRYNNSNIDHRLQMKVKSKNYLTYKK